MWLGMLAALVGQLPGLPVQPLTGLAGLLAAYVAQIAHWLGSPGWARASVPLPSAAGVLAAYAALAPGALGPARLGAPSRAACGGRRAAVKPLALAACLGVLVLGLAGLRSWGGAPAEPAAGLRVVVLDVGQGDAILLDPADGQPVVVDGGPPGDDLRRQLEDEGVSALAAAVVTHDQSDHAGGIDELLGVVPGPPAALRRARPGLPPGCARRRRPRDVDRGGVGGRFGEPADRGAVAAAGRSRWRCPERPEPGGARAACPVAAASACCSRPTRRPRRCRSTPVRSTSSRWLTTARTTPASIPCSTAASRVSR